MTVRDKRYGFRARADMHTYIYVCVYAQPIFALYTLHIRSNDILIKGLISFHWRKQKGALKSNKPGGHWLQEIGIIVESKFASLIVICALLSNIESKLFIGPAHKRLKPNFKSPLTVPTDYIGGLANLSSRLLST